LESVKSSIFSVMLIAIGVTAHSGCKSRKLFLMYVSIATINLKHSLLETLTIKNLKNCVHKICDLLFRN